MELENYFWTPGKSISFILINNDNNEKPAALWEVQY